MTPTKTAAVIDRRDELENEQANLIVACNEARAQATIIREQISAARGEAHKAHVEAIRKGAAADTTDIERDCDELRRQADELESRALALNAAALGIPRKIAELHQSEWPAFAEAAERDTARAVEAFAALEDAYRDALDAWRVAETAWNRVTSDFDRRDDENDGVRRSGANHATRRVPRWPLPDPAEVFTADAPRPRPAGLLPPGHRGQGEPGTYRDSTAIFSGGGGEQQLDTKNAVLGSVHLVKPDKRGFAKLHRTGD